MEIEIKAPTIELEMGKLYEFTTTEVRNSKLIFKKGSYDETQKINKIVVNGKEFDIQDLESLSFDNLRAGKNISFIIEDGILTINSDVDMSDYYNKQEVDDKLTVEIGEDPYTIQDAINTIIEAFNEIIESFTEAISSLNTDIANTNKEVSRVEGIANQAIEKAETAESIAKGANQSLPFDNYGTMITFFNNKNKDAYKIGQNVYIKTKGVPDLWVSEITETSFQYWYTSDEKVIEDLNNGNLWCGHYKFSELETQKVNLTDYYTKDDVDTILFDYITSNDLETTLEDYASKNYVDNLVGNIDTILQDIDTGSGV